MSKYTSRKHTHIILCTKNNTHIHSSHIGRLYDYMREVIKQEGIVTVGLNGMTDHVHILCILSEGTILSESVKKIKDATKQWLKDCDPRYNDFDWKKGYGAFIVRPPVMITVQHIINQEYLHERMTFEEEIRMFYNDHRDKTDSKGKFWGDD